MQRHIVAAAAASAFILSGCATPPQQEIALSKASLQSPATRIGVAMSPLPKVDTSFPGAGCLLCLAAASVANSKLTTHTQTLPADDIARVKTDVADLLRKKGYTPVVIAEPVKVGDLPKAGEGPNKPKHDFSSLRAKYAIDKLVMIEISTLGITRNYSSYIPSGAPQGVVDGAGYLVNLADNTYEWYLPLHQVRSAAGTWDEAPTFPGLTNAYFQAVEGARDALLQPFSN